jgi:hypothetical protein
MGAGADGEEKPRHFIIFFCVFVFYRREAAFRCEGVAET